MSNLKTSQEAAASTLDGTEVVRIVQAGANKRTTLAEVVALATGGPGGGSDLGWVTCLTHAQILAGVTAVNASSGQPFNVMYIGPGVFTFTDELHFTQPVQLIGAGRAGAQFHKEYAFTALVQTTTNKNMLNFGVDPWNVRDIHVQSSWGSDTPTGGDGIHSDVGNGSTINNVSTEGFYRGINLVNAAMNQLQQVFVYAPYYVGVELDNLAIPDGGDQFLNGIYLSAGQGRNAEAAIRTTSGGGLKIQNIKVNMGPAGDSGRFVNGIEVAVGNSTVTQDLLIDLASIENLSGTPIKITSTGGHWPYTILDNIQCATYGSPNAIDIESSSVGLLDMLTIGSVNATQGGSGDAVIKLRNVNNVKIGTVLYTQHTKVLDIDSTVTTIIDNANRDGGTNYSSSASGTITMDTVNWGHFHYQLSGDITLANPSTYRSGTTTNVNIDSNGHGVTWGNKFVFPDGFDKTLSSGSDVFSFLYSGLTDKFYCVGAKKFS